MGASGHSTDSILRSRRALRNATLLATVVAILAAPSAPAVSATGTLDWDTYGFNSSREGLNPDEHTINTTNVHQLHQVWSFRLGSVIDTQPLFAFHVPVPDPKTHTVLPKNLVIAGSENGNLAAINATTGKRVWLRRLGHVGYGSCGDLPHSGITDTPVIDRATDRLYVAGGRGSLDQLDLATGRTIRHWTVTRQPYLNHVWGALTMVRGRVYAETASDCDMRPYRGQVMSINKRTGSVRRWFDAPPTDGGGIWGWGGLSVDPKKNALYAATGNSFAPPNEHTGYAEHVVRLSLGLRVQAGNYPGLHPDTGDADFGFTPALYQAPGCPPQLAAGNKFGNFFVYDRDRIDSGPVQRIQLGGSGFGNIALLGVAPYSPSQRLLYVANPQRRGGYGPGILAFGVTGNCRLALRWQANDGAPLTSPATIADGVLFYGTGSNGRVVGLDASSGKRLWVSPGVGGVFNAPSVVNGVVYVPSWDGRVHAFKL